MSASSPNSPGLDDRPPKFTWTFVVHASVWGLLAILFLVIVPRFLKTFKDFDAELPSLTITLIDISLFLGRRWYLAIPWLAAYFGALYYVWRGNRSAAWAWSFVMIFGVAVLYAFALIGLYLPLWNLYEKLS